MNIREKAVALVQSSSIRGATLNADLLKVARWVAERDSEAEFRFDLHINPGPGEQPHVILYVRQASMELCCRAGVHPESLTDGFSWKSEDREILRQAYGDLLGVWKKLETLSA